MFVRCGRIGVQRSGLHDLDQGWYMPGQPGHALRLVLWGPGFTCSTAELVPGGCRPDGASWLAGPVTMVQSEAVHTALIQDCI